MKQTITKYIKEHAQYITIDTSDDYNDSHNIVTVLNIIDVKVLVKLALEAQRELGRDYEHTCGGHPPLITEIEVEE